jgi:hypothetical protein
MAQQPNQQPQMVETEPRTVIAAKGVDLVLVRYKDDSGREITQLAIMGDSTVHLLDSREIGFGRAQTPSGQANEWLRKGIFAKLGRKVE